MHYKQKYRPKNTLSSLSKVFEKFIYFQINTYLKDKFSKYLTRFYQNLNIQHVLLNMIENWENNLNKRNKIAIFMDLAKAFDTQDHSELIAKLEAYGFDSLSLEFMKKLSDKQKREMQRWKPFQHMEKNYIRCPIRFHT